MNKLMFDISIHSIRPNQKNVSILINLHPLRFNSKMLLACNINNNSGVITNDDQK